MYLYIFEDSKFKESEKPPSEEDAECVTEGLLSVLLFQGGHYFEYNPWVKEEQWVRVDDISTK